MTRIVIGGGLSVLGGIAVTVVSFHSLETVVFFWPSDRFRLLRVVLIFVGGIGSVASGTLILHNKGWARPFFASLLVSGAGLAGLGVMRYVVALYFYRQPHFASHYEITWFCVGLVAFLLAVHHWRPRRRRKRHAASDVSTVRRVIWPGPRPFIAVSIIFGSLAVIFLLIDIWMGRWDQVGQSELMFLGIGAAACIAVSGNRIVVTADYLDYRVSFIPKGRVYFRDVAASVPVTLAERDWPVRLEIYERHQHRPEMVLLMKPWRKADVDWLLSLPQLRVQSARPRPNQSMKPTALSEGS